MGVVIDLQQFKQQKQQKSRTRIVIGGVKPDPLPGTTFLSQTDRIRIKVEIKQLEERLAMLQASVAFGASVQEREMLVVATIPVSFQLASLRDLLEQHGG